MMRINISPKQLKVGDKYYLKTKNTHLNITSILYKASCQRVRCIDFDDITSCKLSFCCDKIFYYAIAADSHGKNHKIIADKNSDKCFVYENLD